jgi:O-antigen/teichoic acid export membrane protein
MRDNSIFLAAFVVFTTASALHSMVQQTFVAFRRTGFTLFQGTIFGTLRLVLAAVLASFFGAFGIFAASGLAFTVSLVICLLIFIPLILPRYRPLPSFRRQAGNEIIKFSLANYAGEGLWSLPSWILPIMVLNILGAEANAYFYMPWSMASLLLALSLAISFSLFAEGSYEARNVSRHLKSGFKLIVLLLVPTAAILAIFGDKILLVFGGDYSAAGTQLLRLFTLAAFPLSFNLLYLSVARVEKRLKSLLWVNGVTAVATLVLSYITIVNLGILGIGVSWLAAQTSVALFTTTKLIQKVYHPGS